MDSKKENVIYMDRVGYNMYLKEIEDLKAKLLVINKGRKDAFAAGSGDGWDSPEFEEIERNSRMIQGEIDRRLSLLQSIEIIELKGQDDIIDLNDTVRVNINFDEDDKEEMVVRLVGSVSTRKNEGDITDISVNSPLGSAIYGKKVGEVDSYKVEKNIFNVQVIEIIKNQQQQGYVRKLKL